ncbi:MAG: phosphoglycerate mutase, partial [Clostridia bacterium]|nr:phosphoglycerate mutase [Clostridia bacterium]
SSGEEYRILLMPDHPTPLNIMTHTSDPVPYILYKSDDEIDSGVETYNEKTAAATGKDAGMGCTLMNRMLS